MATIRQIRQALADAIETELVGTANPLIPNLQVESRMVPNCTPPCIDVYPGDPFEEPMGFGPGNKEYYFTVRARVGTPDNEAGQDLIDTMMDSTATTSVEQALFDHRVLGNGAVMSGVEGPTGYNLFGPQGEALLGTTWRVRVVNS